MKSGASSTGFPTLKKEPAAAAVSDLPLPGKRQSCMAEPSTLLAARVTGPGMGGVVTFVGAVRDEARGRAIRHLERGRPVIFACGTGNPFFTTDTTAALRAVEMGCDAMAKATQVDGVYAEDPKKNPNAERYDRLTYSEVLARDLKVMDGAAIALARDNDLPVIVFSIEEPGNLMRVVRGGAHCTVIEK